MIRKQFHLLVIFYLPVLITSVKSGNDADSKQEAELFKKLFVQQRIAHLEAVKAVRKLRSEKKQALMISVVAEKIFSVLKSSRSEIESSGYVPGLTEFPENEKTRDALSNILGNTAFFGDILLRFPDISHKIFNSSQEWNLRVLYEWGVMFSKQTQLLDPKTEILIDLVCQELNFTERSPDYINPYVKEPKTTKINEGSINENIIKKVKKRQKLPRGPRLSNLKIKDEL